MIASPTSTPQLDPISAPADISSLSSSKVTTPTLAASTPTTPFKPTTNLNHNATAPDLIPLDDIPELSLEPLQTEDEQAEGLKLIADTVGGMRGAATVSIMSHPSCIVPFTAYLSLIYYSRYAIPGHFKVTACYTYGSVVVYIFLIWCLAYGYKRNSKDINRAWLDEEGPNRDIMVGARTKDHKLAGVVVLRLSPKLVPTGGRRRTRSLSLRGGRGLIRAWAVRRKARCRGVGKELLQAAVRITRERCGKDAEMGFVQDHAHSRLLFHNMYNGFFRKVEVAADKALRQAVDDWSVTKKKKR